MRTCYINGVWVAEQDLKISAWDLATMQGASCFEMLRSFRHQHFKLREHLERLRQSCQLLSIPLPADLDNLETICAEVTERNPMPLEDEHRLLIVVNAGAAPMYSEIDGVIPHSYCYVATFPLRYTVAGFSKYFTEGVHCVTSKIQQVPDACVPSAAKHRSRLHFHLAQQQAPAGTWPLMLAEDGQYAEAPGANLVFAKKGKVYVCRRDALPGISMETVRELTGALDGWFYEDWQKWCMGGDEKPFDELWLTGTPFAMVPVVSLDGQPIGDGTPGPVYKATLAKWSELVGVDIKAQIERWDNPSTIWTPDAQRTRTT